LYADDEKQSHTAYLKCGAVNLLLEWVQLESGLDDKIRISCLMILHNLARYGLTRQGLLETHTASVSERVRFFGAMVVICLLAADESSESQHLLQAGRCIPILLDVLRRTLQSCSVLGGLRFSAAETLQQVRLLAISDSNKQQLVE
jgi:hypothetical protein